MSYVYFIQADEDGPIKIGTTSDDPQRRLRQLQTGNASKLRLLGAIRGTSVEEKKFHASLSEWQRQGEWFEAHPAVLATIQEAILMAEQNIGEPCGLHCSFCFGSQDDVGILIQGPAANICGECVAVCVERIKIRSSEPKLAESLREGDGGAT